MPPLRGFAVPDTGRMCAPSETAIWSYAALRAAGRSRAWVRSALSHGSLVRVRRGVYASSDACAAAVAAAAHGGAPACVFAARHLGIWVLDDDPAPHVWMNADGHPAHPDGCGCVEHWDEAPVAARFAMPSVPRILRQILGCCGIEAFFVALESALRRRLITRAGIGWLRAHTNDAAREAITLARSDADSGLESLLRWRLRMRGLRIRSQVRIVGVGTVDFLIGDRLIVEIDGRLGHDGESERHKDLVRDANAAAWDYVTLRFDYAMVMHDWELVEGAILAQVAARRHVR